MQLILVIVASIAFSYVFALLIMKQILLNNTLKRARIRNLFSTKQKDNIHRSDKRDKESGKTQLSFKVKAIKKLSTELSLAGMLLRAEEFIIIWVILILLPAGLALLAGADSVVGIALAICGFAIPVLFVKKEKAKRLALFEQQLSDALIIIGNCLRTGLSFQQAMESIARDMPDPISKEFARVSREVRLGLTMEAALENMVERLGSKDFMLIVSAVLIQRQVGGNLSEILDDISETIRERLKIKASIKILTASGRASGMVVGLMPVFIFLILMLINPPYVKSFFESQLGMSMLFLAVGLEAIGFLTVKKIVSIKF